MQIAAASYVAEEFMPTALRFEIQSSQDSFDFPNLRDDTETGSRAKLPATGKALRSQLRTLMEKPAVCRLNDLNCP